MAEMFGIVPMERIVSRYETIVSQAVTTTPNITRIVKANPQRLWIKFIPQSGTVLQSPILPGPVSSDYVLGSVPNTNETYMFRDCPSVVTGEWFVAMQVGSRLTIIECCFLG